MTRGSKWRMLSELLVLALVSVAGVYAYLFWCVKRIDFARPPSDVKAIGESIEAFAKQARTGSIPWRKKDYTGVGSQALESELLELRNAVGIFEASRRRLPVDVAELSGLSYPLEQRRTLKRLAKTCQMFVLREDSYVLNCDGWTLPNPEEWRSLVGSFDPETERFYRLETHVLLYVPPLTKGTPRASPAG